MPTQNPVFPVTTQEINWLARVIESWGDDWGKKETAYRWSNGRTFEDSGSNGGIYDIE